MVRICKLFESLLWQEVIAAVIKKAVSMQEWNNIKKKKRYNARKLYETNFIFKLDVSIYLIKIQYNLSTSNKRNK